MKDTPILFCGVTVRAILEGRKSQTRRVMKPQPFRVLNGVPFELVTSVDATKILGPTIETIPCPYGQPGDRLWVKETFARIHTGLLQHLDPEPDYPNSTHWSSVFRADGEPPHWEDYGINWRPSIFMPRWASRITLEITGIRVERVQDISEEDAKAEGTPRLASGVIVPHSLPPQRVELTHRDWYRDLWNSIDLKPSPIYHTEGKRKVIVGYECYPWSADDFDAKYPRVRESRTYRGKPITVTANPWVWVVEFKREGQR